MNPHDLSPGVREMLRRWAETSNSPVPTLEQWRELAAAGLVTRKGLLGSTYSWNREAALAAGQSLAKEHAQQQRAEQDSQIAAHAALLASIPASERDDSVRRQALRWVVGSPVGEMGKHYRERGSEFDADPSATSHGVRFSRHERERAFDFLVANGLVKAGKSFDEHVVIQPTERGRDALNSAGDETLAEWCRSGGSSVTSVSIGAQSTVGSVQAAGARSTQIAQQGEENVLTFDDHRDVSSQIAKLLNALPDEAAEASRELVNLLGELSQSPKKGQQWKPSLDKITTAAMAAGASEVVLEGIKHLGHLLGIATG